jgi:hypothetical protein
LKRFFTFLALITLFPVNAFAWGETGHTMINRLAAEALPASMPAFVRSASAVDEIATLGPEEDRIKDAGTSWDSDNDPGHYLDIGDDGTVDGVVRLDALPKDMEAYARALESAGSDPYRTGYVPYTIMDGFERMRKDFAIWRIDDYMAVHATTDAARAAFAQDRTLREDLTLRDIGDWGHFVGDGSQPLHITIHFNGWGNYPDPNGYTENHIHSYFESDFVDKYAKIGDVRAMMKPYVPDLPEQLLTQAQIGTLVGAYLEGTSKAVDPLYALYAAQDFQNGDQRAIDFTDEQLARGASELRNLIALAWADSLNQTFGYPAVPVRDVLSGKVAPVSPSETS